MLRIAFPNKGRLAEDARELFGDAGLDVRVRNERALTASVGGVFEAVFVRAKDIPEFVADGAANIGITGWDLVEESGRALTSAIDLEFGRCRLAVAATDESGIRTIECIPNNGRVATSFPRITAKYFAALGADVAIVPVSGAAEIAPHVGIADVIVDLVSTGSTLRVNGLREVATVLDSSAHLVLPERRSRDETAVNELVTALQSVLRARGKRYLMANVPPGRIDEVRKVLPGLNGPTIINILDGGGFVAVHAVVAAASIYRTIADLKSLGAEGILVTRIERLMP